MMVVYMHKCNKRANSIHILRYNFKHKWLWYGIHTTYTKYRISMVIYVEHFINQWDIRKQLYIVENSLFMEIVS